MEQDWSREALELDGFSGWYAFHELPAQLNAIDGRAGGVCLVYRDEVDGPAWLDRSLGGTWRGDPTVSRDILISNWVDGAGVIYIGKANHGQLRNRLRTYCSFGSGGKGRHYGGRYVWQLKNSADLMVAWLTIDDPTVDPREVEKERIAAFSAAYGKRPFANLTD